MSIVTPFTFRTLTMNNNLAAFIANLLLLKVNLVQAQGVMLSYPYQQSELNLELLEQSVTQAVTGQPSQRFDIEKFVEGGILLPNTNGLICLNKVSLESLSNDIDEAVPFELVPQGYF